MMDQVGMFNPGAASGVGTFPCGKYVVTVGVRGALVVRWDIYFLFLVPSIAIGVFISIKLTFQFFLCSECLVV